MKLRSTVACLAATLLASAPAAARADMVSDWNHKLVQLLIVEKTNPLLQSRHAALMHVAIFDAVNGVDQRYAPYAPPIGGAHDASADAAAATAAHRSLVALFPGHQATADAALAQMLQGIADGPAKAAGIALGERAAAAILALRADDGSTQTAAYKPLDVRGAWVPNPGMPPLGVRWGAVQPWALQSGAQFRPGPPPDLRGEQFKRDYLEVVAIGGKTSTLRSAQQTEVANFWIASGPVLWSQAAAQWSAARKLSLTDSARLFALLHLAGADALIACWDAKYAYHNFRPLTAVRDGTGRTDLAADPTWEPAVATPPFPAYPSGHACFSGAAASVLEAAFGSGELPAATLRSPSAPGVERRYLRARDIAAEASDARIWGGIHWRSDQIEGEALGRKVGAHAVATVLRPQN